MTHNWFWISLFLLSTSAWAESPGTDTVTSAQSFAGYNVYSPEVLYDVTNPSAPVYKMWYGGQEAAGTQDAIFRRTAPSAMGPWSAVQSPVLTTAMIYQTISQNPPPGDNCVPGFNSSLGVFTCFPGAVNDPSVTVFYNQAGGFWMWTMFYTVAMCNDTITPVTTAGLYHCNNQVWSSVSSDGGLTWSFHQPVLQASALTYFLFPGTPSAVWEPAESKWRLYFYVNSSNEGGGFLATFVNEIDVASDRTVHSGSTPSTPYLAPGGILPANPHVRYIHGLWHLYFNSGGLSRVTTASNPPNWGSQAPEVVIAPPVPNGVNGAVCDTITPGVLPDPNGGSSYTVYFATPLWSGGAGGVCDIWHEASIQSWAFRAPASISSAVNYGVLNSKSAIALYGADFTPGPNTVVLSGSDPTCTGSWTSPFPNGFFESSTQINFLMTSATYSRSCTATLTSGTAPPVSKTFTISPSSTGPHVDTIWPYGEVQYGGVTYKMVAFYSNNSNFSASGNSIKVYGCESQGTYQSPFGPVGFQSAGQINLPIPRPAANENCTAQVFDANGVASNIVSFSLSH